MALGILVGLILGVFAGIGLCAGFMALREARTPGSREAWIDEAIERAFRAADRVISKR